MAIDSLNIFAKISIFDVLQASVYASGHYPNRLM